MIKNNKNLNYTSFIHASNIRHELNPFRIECAVFTSSIFKFSMFSNNVCWIEGCFANKNNNEVKTLFVFFRKTFKWIKTNIIIIIYLAVESLPPTPIPNALDTISRCVRGQFCSSFTSNISANKHSLCAGLVDLSFNVSV